MTGVLSRKRRRARTLGLLAVAIVVFAACEPEPPPPPPPPTRPECGSVETTPETAAYAITVVANGRRRALRIEADSDFDKAKKVKRLEDEGKRIIAVEPDLPVSTVAADDPANEPYFAPAAPGSDPAYGTWGIGRVNAPAAWGPGPTLEQGQGVTVAVVDTGVQADHPGLAGRVLPGRDYIASAPFDGRIDGNGHGTHVAGIIAENDDSSGGIGVAPQVQILPVRVLGCSGGGSSTDVANGIDWAVANGADVINLSLGTSGPSTTIQLAVEAALNAGVVVVAAGGNGGSACTTPTTSVTTVPTTIAPGVTSSTSTTSSTSSTSTTSTTSTTSSTTTTTVAPGSSTAATPSASGQTSATTVPTGDGIAPIVSPPSTTVAPAPPTTPPGSAAVLTVGGLADATTPTAPCSNPLYPAALAPGRPGLLAVAATANTVGIRSPAAGTNVEWRVAVGALVNAGDPLVTIDGSTTITSPISGTLDRQLVPNGASLVVDQRFAQLRDVNVRSSFSNVNDYISIAAPGGGVPSDDQGIWSTVPGGYGYKSGTSMAAPHVAGVAALVLGRCPALDPGGVAARLTATAMDLGPAGWDPAFGAGLVRADAAVTAGC